ncbi:hypothetical protein F4808DRAFT_445547 [Astrocystis sublimbata]|nr:hypothetical protein F4808DRAFT_445526 [Astrocystis sublimbata]KAI0189444.1 hypothetical protein F4808DRAFT_445547 [Astrocystis sublimbata]
MKFQNVASLWALAAGTGVVAQIGNHAELFSKGPFALHVKGRGFNSSINGYLYTSSVNGATPPLQLLNYYDNTNTPSFDNSSFRFYFNYTGLTQNENGAELGFIVSDIANPDAPINGEGYHGMAMNLRYQPNTNVATPMLGRATAQNVDYTAFDEEGKLFLNYYMDDADAVTGEPVSIGKDLNIYNWAICWAGPYGIAAKTLSWITAGKSHNPTCELVDLMKVAIS